MTFIINIPRPITILAMKQLANVDYNVATRVSESVAETVQWAYQNDVPFVAKYAVEGLQMLDNFGSFLISIVIWIVYHTP